MMTMESSRSWLDGGDGGRSSFDGRRLVAGVDVGERRSYTRPRPWAEYMPGHTRHQCRKVNFPTPRYLSIHESTACRRYQPLHTILSIMNNEQFRHLLLQKSSPLTEK